MTGENGMNNVLFIFLCVFGVIVGHLAWLEFDKKPDLDRHYPDSISEEIKEIEQPSSTQKPEFGKIFVYTIECEKENSNNRFCVRYEVYKVVKE